ncbi:WD repeat-containing protein 44-like isoform X2 [Macadamia integrifolia]|uniref:WD repeat-containing protein 44-like isoform X2 n=2 Tax=Macadamia integrifolia TaxID=60698 RepID=UPI001C4E7D2E|nr:WD repeat-containing protein 44-like isoform X2 [Macadamia integrifolia]
MLVLMILFYKVLRAGLIRDTWWSAMIINGGVALHGNREYEIWRKEPRSIRERRGIFLGSMGFNEFALSRRGCSLEIDGDTSCSSSPENAGVERITECSGAVSRLWASCGDVQVEDLVYDGRETDARTESVDQELDSSTPKKVASSREKYGGQLNVNMNKMRTLWRSLKMKSKGREAMGKVDDSGSSPRMATTNRLHVRHNRKRLMEFTGLYMGQEIQAHKGKIWTMKFSPDGCYLASGGEDGVVRIWRITSADASYKYVTNEGSSKFLNMVKGGKLVMGRKNLNPASVVIPKKVFKVEESPVQEFHGHVGHVLDLCWSKSNFLLSSSNDKTVRLWKVGSDECLNVFYHNNYVTCIQFNPVDEGYFISGSIDGKLRLWGVSEGRVVDWADARDIITAICYEPDGQGCIVGSITGSCRFYDASANHLQLDAQICIQRRKKCFGNRITGIQFSMDDFHRVVMITSADSKVRILSGVEVIHKYRGLSKSGSQMSASFTSSGRHIISVGEDSRVYIWNYGGSSVPSYRQPKSVRSCENFFVEGGVSVAIPWSGGEMACCSPHCSLKTQEHLDSVSWLTDTERFSLGSWFSMDGSSRTCATWPEEKLPFWAVPVTDHDHHHPHHHHSNHTALSATWGMVIVTAGWDGVIRTFHNYGLPVVL